MSETFKDYVGLMNLKKLEKSEQENEELRKALKEISNLSTINHQLVDAQYIALIALKDKDI